MLAVYLYLIVCSVLLSLLLIASAILSLQRFNHIYQIIETTFITVRYFNTYTKQEFEKMT